jgi:hypothetical protein
MKLVQGLEMYQDFACAHHGEGPVDSFSKKTRAGMDADVAFGKFQRYSYEHCFDWCIKNMQKPDNKHKHGGTYGANGKYMYRAYSEGSDVNARGFPVVPKDRSFQTFPGSNEIYRSAGKTQVPPRTRSFACAMLLCALQGR